MPALLEIRNLSKIYDNGTRALKNISFQVSRGEFVAVIGLSGSGKSTLLRCINRLVDPTEGEITFNGVEMTKLTIKELRAERKKIGMIFQHFNLIKRKSVLANVLSGKLASTPAFKSCLGIFSKEDRDAANRYLSIVGLAEKANIRASELSGGQQQRVAIARSLLQDPLLLLADEPVASLDPSTSHSVMKYLETANKEMGKTILCNLHFLSLVRQYATRAIALKNGEIVFDGRAAEIDNARFKQIYGEDAVELGIN